MAHYIKTILVAMTLVAIYLAQAHMMTGFSTNNSVEILIGAFYAMVSFGTMTMVWRLIITEASTT